MGPLNAPLFGLAPGGVYPATGVATCAVRPYRTISPLPALGAGGIFSVALSVGSRPPGVTWHPAQRSPDFPPGSLPATARPTPPLRLPELFPARDPPGDRVDPVSRGSRDLSGQSHRLIGRERFDQKIEYSRNLAVPRRQGVGLPLNQHHELAL